jgi:antitoxin (DNA-binding transcriptional repressor) of toxin-antitoxin stability system
LAAITGLSILDKDIFCPCHDHHLVETGIFVIMTPIVRPMFSVLLCLVAMGCQSASLQDAAPTAVPVARPDDGALKAAASEDNEVSVKAGGSSQVLRRNPGVASVVPLEQTAPVENKEFVASGASRTGQFPTFAKQPKAANAQFSDQEKLATEAEMAELLRNRASTPNARARYEARLKQLRAVAASHGSGMQQEIEN